MAYELIAISGGIGTVGRDVVVDGDGMGTPVVPSKRRLCSPHGQA